MQQPSLNIILSAYIYKNISPGMIPGTAVTSNLWRNVVLLTLGIRRARDIA